jgi:hypothetical protein
MYFLAQKETPPTYSCSEAGFDHLHFDSYLILILSQFFRASAAASNRAHRLFIVVDNIEVAQFVAPAVRVTPLLTAAASPFSFRRTALCRGP